MRLPISIKLAMTYLAVVCAVGLPAILAIDRMVARGLHEQRDRELLSRARLLAEALATGDAAAGLGESPGDPLRAAAAEVIARVDPIVDRLGAAAGARVRLFGPDGRLVGDSELDPAAVLAAPPAGGRDAVDLALATGQGLARARRGRSALVHAAARLPAPGAAAVVLLSAPQGEVEAVIRSIRARLLAATGAALVLGLLLSLTAGRVVSAPLRTMTRVARQLASGSRGERLRLPPGDELGDLAAALDRMGAERARSVEELESEKEQLRGVLDGMAEGVLLLGLSGRILLANGAARAALPHGEELVGRTPLEVTRSPELDALVQEARGAGGAPARGQVTLAGGTRAFDASVIPLAGADGGLIIVLHEITELKRLETVRREFVANISHELRTPLTAIRGFIDTLADDPDLAAADRERFLAAAGRHVHRLSNLVDDLLALARLDSPEYQLDLVPCDLQTAIANAIELHSGGARERQVAVRGEVEPGLPPVSADPGALDQILSNLINNAIKYNRAGGRVVVRAVQAGDLVRVAVEDSGVGIAAVHLPRIFERLYRVDPGRSRAEGGTGLGLAIVKHLVLKHGGDVWVTSEPGVGSTFWFTLRLVLGAKAARS